ncbi:MAG: metallophosphoesterase [Sphingomonadales bacterium]|nr:metallophosphoesterase [Sphingomonadales bacterium]MBD3772471.1 metallophosphoesterase [Paracoccaceae bacterium]
MDRSLPSDSLASIAARRRRKWGRRLAAGIATLLALFVAMAWYSTMRDPLVRSYTLQPAGLEAPLTIVLLSDIHVSGPDMPPERVARIVRQINALQPDVIMIAGDIVSDKRSATRLYSTAASVAPLAGLKARLGKVAVPGNHDHWRNVGDVRRELEKAGFIVLQNDAVAMGPLTIGGLDDDFTRHADLPKTLAAMGSLEGMPILLSHSPDPFADLPPGNLLMLAGHTHCGQINWPWGGSPATMSRYGTRYACGVVKEHGNTLVVTAGLGTSVLPFRFLAWPDVWRVELATDMARSP